MDGNRSICKGQIKSTKSVLINADCLAAVSGTGLHSQKVLLTCMGCMGSLSHLAPPGCIIHVH